LEDQFVDLLPDNAYVNVSPYHLYSLRTAWLWVMQAVAMTNCLSATHNKASAVRLLML